MLASPQTPVTLGALLTASVEGGQALLAALQTEQQALGSKDCERIETATRDKIACLQTFQALEAQREALCRQTGHAVDRAGMETLLAAHDDARGTLRAQWHALLKILTECQQLNQINGRSVDINRRQVQHALEILRGQVADVELYQPGGNTPSTLAGRSLGRA